MIKDVAIEMLNLIGNGEGLEKYDLYTKPNMDVQKIIDIIVSECKCSIIDKSGNYARFGSSIDIRVVKNIVKIFLSNAKEIPPEIVSMALTNDGILGPFRKLEIQKKYNEETNSYQLNMERLFPKDFNSDFFEKNLETKNKFIDQIIKPYVKNIIFENNTLMSKSPIGAWIGKKTSTLKTNDELLADLVEILSNVLDCDKEITENIANYILINIMSNKNFKEELIQNSINTTDLQKLGKVYTGFNGLVENMVSEAFKMIQMKDFPNEEYETINDCFYTVTAVLQILSSDFEGLNEDEILAEIQEINNRFNIGDTVKNNKTSKYRNEELQADKSGNIIEFVNPKDIASAMDNLCKMIKVLIEKKDEIGVDTYIKEAIRIHYRFIRIHPYEQKNGRTARAVVNILLQSKEMVGIFRKEKRKEYMDSLMEAHKIIKENENRYIDGIVNNPMDCVEMENQFLDRELPFLLVKY